ncbi:MAG: DNA mismatch repair protein MutS [Elusimicrobia bacterium]|nr:DNA mismatch repair protein MutS [Elusimicrobiota bacterium]
MTSETAERNGIVAGKENLTPLMAQYENLKSRHANEILLFRLGDFYEIFGEDAKTAAPILEVALTQRQGVPMCGVPYHALERYIPKLLKRSFRVAVAEQLEDPSTAKGIVKRDIVRVISSGTILEENLLQEKSNNFLVAVAFSENILTAGLAALDISTGQFTASEVHLGADFSALANEISRLNAAEILLNRQVPQIQPLWNGIPLQEISDTRAATVETEALQLDDPSEWKKFPLALQAAKMVTAYVRAMTPECVPSLRPPQLSHLTEVMALDKETIENLEILKNSYDGTSARSLLQFLDSTVTPMGGRLLKSWLIRPLLRLEQIQDRLKKVEFFREESGLRKACREHLKGCSDLERLATRIRSQRASPRDLIGLKLSLIRIQNIRQILAEKGAETDPQIKSFASRLRPEPELVALLQNAIVEEPPVLLENGNVIRAGYDPVLDEKRKAAREGKFWLQELESKEREKTGIPTFKVGYTSVFGYYFEVTKPHLSKVPPHWHRKQTLINSERFVNEELKKLEETILGAEEQSLRMEKSLFQNLVSTLRDQMDSIQKNAQVMAELDCLLSFAEVAEKQSLCKPQMDPSDVLQIREGWHPVVKESLPSGSFVPNDTHLNSSDHQIIILTGPNMSGKSTYLRQTALIVLMAQSGSFVPAKEAKIGVADRIFTRIGSGDRLAQGESTFMVEMRETSKILKSATAKSLIILDEVGRGTSTYDGLSIAWSVIEYLTGKSSKVLFATHYFELTHLAAQFEKIKNYHVEAKEWQETVLFLHKIEPGPADRSYGIHVAQLAGLPSSVIQRAKKILQRLEQEHSSVLESRGQVQPELF